eukprot:TCALIF_04399-PA protein Name:"Similar to BSDC1 BSD domain-containing protein 1 (Bos taurus)" AED:0.12 eAED:0.12 QI:742/0.75/0.6/1/1/1/5/0/398
MDKPNEREVETSGAEETKADEKVQGSSPVRSEPKPEEAPEGESLASDEAQVEQEASGLDWWGGGLSSWVNPKTLEKAMTSVSSVTNSAVQAAKERSSEVYGFVAKDLSEVSATATSAVGSTATTLKKSLEWDWYYCDPNMYSDVDIPVPVFETKESEEAPINENEEFDEKTDVLADKAVDSMKKSVSSFWSYASGYANQMFVQDDLEADAILVRGDNPVLLDRLQAQLHALASDPGTFEADPHPKDKVQWDEWACDLDKRQGEISDLMVNNPDIRQHYTAMVPEKVSHKLFWRRYFFKVHLIELQEAKRQALKKRAEQTQRESESGINWDDVDDLVQTEISDEVQDKLLADYEKEITSKKPSKQDSLSEEMAKATIRSDRSSPEEKGKEDTNWKKGIE